MASRQTQTNNLNVYAAPASYANSQTDINLANQTSNPRLGYMNSGGLGALSPASQTLPILPFNATPSTNGLTSSGTTATVTLGSPHNQTIGSSGQIFTITNAGISGYNITGGTVVSITGPYTFTYTLAGGASGLAASGGGVVGMQNSIANGVPTQSFQPVLNGTSIAGSTCGPVEIWSDGAIWDTTNSRYITPQLGGYDPANFRS